MPIAVPPRYIGGSLKARQARPLNGLEVREAVETHLLTLTDRLLGNIGLLSDQVADLAEELRKNVRTVFSRQTRLGKVHITYPKVGWNIKTRVEQLEDHSYVVNAEVELDLERNIRINLQFGESGRGIVIASLEEEKIPTDTPDTDRRLFGMPVEAEYVRPDGTIGKVDIRELRGEKKIARTIDVGSGKDNREPREVPAEIEIDGEIVIGTKEILMAVGEGGQPITLPQDHPEISLDDQHDGYMYNGESVVATVPEVPKEPPKAPLPPRGISKIGAPNVKFKDRK
jgi:hypothetical protein